jgi:hypothetical protein
MNPSSDIASPKCAISIQRSARNRSRNSDLHTGWTAEESRSIPHRGNWFLSSKPHPGPGVKFSRCEADHSPTPNFKV